MNGDWRAICTSGQPFSFHAQTKNDISRTSRAHDFARQRIKAGPLGMEPPEGLVLVQNTTSATINRFGILGISGIVVSPSANLSSFQNVYALTGTTPTTSSHLGKFCIAYEPIAKNAIGRAFMFGVCPTQIYINTAGDKFADVKNSDSTQLNSGAVGTVQILYAPSGTGKQWCLVRFCNQGPDLFPVNLAQTGGTNGSGGATPTQATFTYTVKDLAGNTLGTAVGVAWAREYGGLTAATHGHAYYNSSGTLILDSCDEIAQVKGCS